MKVGDLGVEHFAAELAGDGVAIRWGPFVSRIVTPLPDLAASLHFLYADFPIDEGGLCDFHVRVRPTLPRLPWLTEVLLDHEPIYRPFHRRIALAMFEWGLNWCVYAFAHRFLIIHAAVVERAGDALLLPGEPGAGKSTLCAGLVSNGWRLLSDELALLDPAAGHVLPLARPISLKGDAIDLIRGLFPDAVLGPPTADTHKGRITHMRPPSASVLRAGQPAVPRWIVAPQFVQGEGLRLEQVSKATAFFRVANNSLNYAILRESGFRSLSRLIDQCECYQMSHSSLREAVAALNDLCASAVVQEHHAARRA